MKNIFLGIVLIGFQFTFAQHIKWNEYEIKINAKDFNFNGNVKKVISTAKDINGNYATIPFLENEFYNQIVLEFNSKVNLSKRTNNLEYNGKLGVYSFTDYQYNSSQLPTEIKTTVLNNGEDPMRVSSLKQYAYHSNGQINNLQETIQSKTSSTTYQTLFNYSNRLEKVQTKVDGAISGEVIYTYNRAGKLIQQETIGFNGKSGLTKYFIYDGATPIYEEINNNGNKQMTFINQHHSVSKFQQFDQNQNLKLELNFDQDYNVTEAKVQSFKAGQPILNTYQIKYNYDSKNNWIMAQVYNQGDLKYVVTREISYQ